MRHPHRTLTAAAAATLLGLGAVAGVANSANASTSKSSIKVSISTSGKDALGLSANGTTLYSFRLNNPANDRRIGAVSGLTGDTSLIGIDFRVQDRKFYGVGNAGGVYTLDTGTAKATLVNQLSIPLSGTVFDIDFNPAADRLRILSNDGQNLRHNVNAGGVTLLDKPLAYVVGTPALGVTAGGYTNNDLNAATATALVDIDTNLDQVALQVPANDGALSATGALGIKVGPAAGFDILSTLKGGIAEGNQGFAVLTADGASRTGLYRVDLLSGHASKIGSFDRDIVDLAVVQPK